MLYKYKNDYKKIAMGLLSFIPNLKEVSRLLTEIEWYEAQDDRCLFLWKNDDGDFCGIIGAEIDDAIVMVRHVAVSPQYRKEGVSFEMFTSLAQRYPDHKMMGSFEVAPLLTKWEKNHGQE
ncbi:GNAT family N-acetyltransferase [Ligilactobacillus pobuzihii]|uniref:RibT protein n=1 Tax=Ligilactobacillus pobuzihii TaxID=449659 RepID=A0A0R2LR34_9LACO|nr:GNAT family N-acetyltransferase [Ligilactobacillus pobuzihii]KRK11417.1 RibT protein [Ligilactobacillus pobuzihii E100301 = KCTC 13174]KRO02732.1 RibT protein [Ligilactobacillus pobuzihii]GEN47317.1 reductase [Ligilactobacillus pobuzihii]